MMLQPYQKFPIEQKDIDDMRKVLSRLPKEFTAMDAINAMCKFRGAVSTSDVLNALDHLVMASEIVELTAGTECWGQHRRYTQ